MISERNAAFTNAWCKKKLHRLHRLHAKYLEFIAEKPANEMPGAICFDSLKTIATAI